MYGWRTGLRQGRALDSECACAGRQRSVSEGAGDYRSDQKRKGCREKGACFLYAHESKGCNGAVTRKDSGGGYQVGDIKGDGSCRKKRGLDCLITNPALVQTGLDLIEFPTVVYCQSGYSVYTLRQSSRRSWRIGQDKPVKIYYFVYTGTMQEQALKLLALKINANLIIEGELGEDGLATYNVGNDNLFYELARNIANNVSIEESLDNIWKGAQEKEKKGAGSDLLIESLDDYENKPDLNGALKRPVAEIKRKYTPDIWDKLYVMKMQEKEKKQDVARKRREKKAKALPADSPIQISMFG